MRMARAGKCLLIHLLTLENKIMTNKGFIYLCAFFIVNAFTFQSAIGQSNHFPVNNSFCLDHSPCLYWDSTSQKETILNFYETLYESLDESDFNIIKHQRDLLLLHANWGDTLFEKELRCYECLIDLFYNIYLEKQRKTSLNYFFRMNDSIKLIVIHNNDTIKYAPRRMKVFCYMVDTTGEIIHNCRAISYDKGILYPYSPPSYPTYAILKYHKRYYSIGWIFGGDIMTVAIFDYTKQRNQQRKYMSGCELEVTHARNGSQFTQQIDNIRIYSNENRKKLNDRL